MFASNFSKKIALLMGNFLNDCKEDVKRIEKILEPFNFEIIKCYDCYPKDEILKISKKINENTLLYIHFSGHGRKIGKNINNKGEIVSSWLNPNRTLVSSYEIDLLLSSLNCFTILSSDSCYSGNFGKYFQGKYPFIFIGTSSINIVSNSYSIKSKPSAGILVCLYEDILEREKDIDIIKLKEESISFFTKNKIRRPDIIIKIFN